MLFEDPYKNIHGQTVDTSGYTYDSSGHLSAHEHNPNNLSNDRPKSALGAVVVVVVFLVLMSTITPIFALLFMIDTPDDSLTRHTYSYYMDDDNLQDHYTLQEIAKKFSLANKTVTFTATHYVEPAFLSPDGSVGIRYRGQAGMAVLNLRTTPYGMGKINTFQTNCENDSTGNCVVINNEYHKSDMFDVIIHKTEKGMSSYTYYVAISTTLVEISFSPYTNTPRDDAKYVPILKIVRNTLTEGDDTPDIDDMITRLELPMNKKIPSIGHIASIDFPEGIKFNTKATDGSNDTYEINVVYAPASKTGLQEIDRDSEMDMIIYKTNGGRTYFVFHQGSSKNEYYISIDRYLYHVDKGQEPRKNLSTKEELIEALSTLAD